MQYVVTFIFITMIMVFPARAEFGFDDGVREPKSMMVAGDSVIDDEEDGNEEADTVDVTVDDDAEDFADPEKPAPAMPEVDPFSESQAQKQQNIKRVVKKIPQVEVQRSIADERIDDSYVQGLIKKRFDYSHSID